MKIVGFKGQDGRRLGVVEGDQLIDLQAADPKAPRDLGEWLRQSKGDLSPIADLGQTGTGFGAHAAYDNYLFAAGGCSGQDRLPGP